MKLIRKLMILGMLLPLTGARQAIAQKDMCVPPVGGLAGLPIIDGIVDSYTGMGPIVYDPGWNGATRWNLSGDNGATTSSKFQAGAGGGALYLSFVTDTPISGQDDTIVLGFSTDGDPAHDWRIHITPFDVALDTGSSLKPKGGMSYWRDSTPATGWNNAGAAEFPVGMGHWLFDNTLISRIGNRWAVEMRIPILAASDGGNDNGGIFIPSSGTYLFYANVLSTTGALPAVVQSAWPKGVDIAPVNGILLTRNTPAVASWGTVSLTPRPECDGISLSWADVGVQDPLDASKIVQVIRSATGVTETMESQCVATDNVTPIGNNNVFVARPLNEMSLTAQVLATFRIANWGIPATNAFDPIGAPSPFPGVTGNPTSPASITPGTKGNLTANWSLTYKQSCQFKFHSHNCIQVDLDSKDPATRFKNKSVQKNMDFVPASTFSRLATISGDSRGAPENEQTHRMLIAVETDEQDGRDAKPPTKAANSCEPRRFRDGDLAQLMARYTKSNLFTWIARGYSATGNKLQIGKNVYEIVHRAGDFGYVAVHDGPLEKWSSTFRGEGMRQLGETGIYFLTVPAGKTTEVETTITAHEADGNGQDLMDSGLLRAFLDIGPNFPQGSFSDGIDGQLSINAGLERFVAPNTSLEGLLGYHAFKSDFGANPKIWQLSLNAKQYFGAGSLHYFVNGGLGAYYFDPGSTTRAGANVGLGVLYDISPKLGLESVYNFHVINTSESRTRFSTVQIGIRCSVF